MMLAQVCGGTETTELHSLQEGIEWYGNYMSIKLLFKKIPALLLVLVIDVIFRKIGQVTV